MRVPVKIVTRENFAKYGQVVSQPSTEAPIGDESFSFWPGLAVFDFHGALDVGICVSKKRPRKFNSIEAHVGTEEILVPIDTAVLVPVATASEAATIPAQSVEVFEVPVGEMILMDKGVLHWLPWPKEADTAKFYVVFREGTPGEDLLIRPLSAEVEF